MSTSSALNNNGTGSSNICTNPISAVSNGVWQGDNPMNFSLPLLIVQICLVLVVTRFLALLLRPFRQPRVIAEIIGGILLGPSALGRNKTYVNHIFPKQSITVLDTVADLGLIFFLFLVGLELDLHAIRRTGKQALSIAAAGICVPFIAGVGVSVVLHRTIASDGRFVPFLIFMGVAMSITAFPVLARILAERKLLTTDVGQMAMSAAAVNDMAAWILLALAVALSGSGKSPLIALWVFLCGLAFVIVMFVIVRPLMALFTRQAVENEPANELHVAITLGGVLVSGFATDAVGIHAIFGAFVFGLIIPKEGAFATMIIEKIEDFVTILMLPLYFASSGLKTNIRSIHSAQSFSLLALVIATACIGKVFGTFAVASLHKMNIRKSLTLGFLMNTKGLVELIVLNIGKDRKVLNDETFAIMVLMALVTTFITTPTVMALYKPARNQVPYSRRVLYVPGSKDDAELRVLACVHGMPNVHAIINLIEASRGTRKRTLRMYILHLLQLTERPSSIMKVQKVRTNGLPSSDYHDNMDSVVLAFEAYGQLSKVTVQAMTAISNFDDMHEDICAIAGQKRACFIVIPFHKHARPVDGVWEGNNPGLRNVNLKVLSHAPCSVGILVDRGIGMASLSSNHVDHNVAVLFFGGPDDREALAFGYRMVEHPGVKLKVFRFIQGPVTDHVSISILSSEYCDRHSCHGDIIEGDVQNSRFSRTSPFSVAQGNPLETSNRNMAEEAKLDEECLAVVKEASLVTMIESQQEITMTRSVTFEERVVNTNAIEVAIDIGRIKDFTLLVMGRGRTPSPMIATLMGRQVEFPELGLIGDALITHSHHTHSSILVIQRHDPALVKEEIDCRKVEDASFSKTNNLLSRGLLVATGPRTPSLQSSPGRDNDSIDHDDNLDKVTGATFDNDDEVPSRASDNADINDDNVPSIVFVQRD